MRRKIRKILNSQKIFFLLMVLIIILLTDAFIPPGNDSEKEQYNSALTVKDPIGIVNANNKAEKTKSKRIIVYYFHRTIRCETCIEIEKLTIEAVNEAFEKELSTGTLELKVMNMEEDINSHFIKEYKLNVQSVILSDMDVSNEKRWKNLDKIWDYVSDEDEFKEYIINEIRAYL